MLTSSKNPFTETSRIVFNQVSGYGGPARLTHKRNHHGWTTTQIITCLQFGEAPSSALGPFKGHTTAFTTHTKCKSVHIPRGVTNSHGCHEKRPPHTFSRKAWGRSGGCARQGISLTLFHTYSLWSPCLWLTGEESTL